MKLLHVSLRFLLVVLQQYLMRESNNRNDDDKKLCLFCSVNDGTRTKKYASFHTLTFNNNNNTNINDIHIKKVVSHQI